MEDLYKLSTVNIYNALPVDKIVSSMNVDAAAVLGLALMVQQITARIDEVPTIGFLFHYIAGNVAVAGVLLRLEIVSTLPELALRMAFLNTVFMITLTTLVMIRRLYFHPLSHFPGERLATMSMLHEAAIHWTGKNALRVQALHEKHGDFVRTGPNQLTINNIDAINSKHQIRDRGPYYELAQSLGAPGISTTRDRNQHAIWRRIWEKGFTLQEAERYSPRLQYHTERFLDILFAKRGEEIEVPKYTGTFAQDVICDLGFGEEIGMQEGKGDPTYFERMNSLTYLFQILGALRMLCDLVSYLPLDEGMQEQLRKGDEMVEKRRQKGTSRHDIFTHLLAKDEETGKTFVGRELGANAQTMLVAGTETTAVALASCFREFAIKPHVLHKLQRELDEAFPDGSNIKTATVVRLPYLNAIVNETLRVHTPAPGGSQYIIPKPGVTIDRTFVPAGTHVRVGQLALMQDDRYFPRGKEFIPERWTEQPELIKNRAAYIPFSYGPTVCLGKSLAYNELRLVIAMVASRFDVFLGESYDDKAFVDGWKDWVTAHLGPLPLKFIPRNKPWAVAPRESC